MSNLILASKIISLSKYFIQFPGTYYQKGSSISNADLLNFMFFVEKGKASILNTQFQNALFIERFVYEGMFANLETIFDQKSYKDCVLKVETRTLIKKIPISAVNHLLETSISFNKIINQTLAIQARDCQNKNNRLRFSSSKYRILNYLLDLAHKKGKTVGYETVVYNPPIHLEIAIAANTARQTTTTLLLQLRKENIIHYTRRYIVFRDLEKIKKLMMIDQENYRSAE